MTSEPARAGGLARPGPCPFRPRSGGDGQGWGWRGGSV